MKGKQTITDEGKLVQHTTHTENKLAIYHGNIDYFVLPCFDNRKEKLNGTEE